MSAKDTKFAKVLFFCSIRTVVCHLFPDHAPGDEDAAALVAEGLVRVNGAVVDDPFHGVSKGLAKVELAGRNKNSIVTLGDRDDEKMILRFANRQANRGKLEDGEVLALKMGKTNIQLPGTWFVSAVPPKFSGPEVCACWSGGAVRDNPVTGYDLLRNPGRATGMSECGTLLPGGGNE